MLKTNKDELNFYKNHLVKIFSKIFHKIPGLEMRVIANIIIGSYWKSELKRINYFNYKLPEQVSADFNLNKKNKILGINFKFIKGNYKVALTEIKLLYNMILGIIEPHERSIEIYGTGFKFNIVDEYPFKKSILEIHAGFNESKRLFVPENIYIKKIEANSLNICSNNKESVNSFASSIKRIKPINRYKLRGIKFHNETFIPKVYKKSK